MYRKCIGWDGEDIINSERKFWISIHRHRPINENVYLLSIITDRSMIKELSFMSRSSFLPSGRMIYLSIQLADFFYSEWLAVSGDKEIYIA